MLTFVKGPANLHKPPKPIPVNKNKDICIWALNIQIYNTLVTEI